MPHHPTRRRFLKSAVSGAALAGLADLSPFLALGSLRADGVKIAPDTFRFSPDIEPIVRNISETARDKRVPMMIRHLRAGLPYRKFLAALFLAALRRPNGHEIWVIHAAHQLSLDARPEEHLLPLFQAMDRLPAGNPKPAAHLLPLKGNLPTADKAAAEFQDAMQRFDAEQAERAIVALARSEGEGQTLERLWHYAGRDRGIVGHKAIGVVNCCRTLQTIGWQHAEPLLRSVVRYFLDGEKQVESYETNLARVQKGIGKLAPDWAGSTADAAATLELHAVLRDGKVDPACELAWKQLTGGSVRAWAIWDAIHLATAELLVRKKGSYGPGSNTGAIHGNTSASALHYVFRASTITETRLLVLLQAVAWAAWFNLTDRQRNLQRDLKITELAGAKLPQAPQDAIAEIFDLLPAHVQQQKPDRASQDEAARKTFAFTGQHAEAQLFMQAARSYLYQKASADPHDYKFAAAMFEDYYEVSPQWRPHLLAASVHFLHGTRSADSPVIVEAREALKKL